MGRIPLLVAGVVIALLGLASYQWVNEVGFFRPEAPINRVVSTALGRAGAIAARQKEQELQKLLDDAERTGHLDDAAFGKAMMGAGQDAARLSDYYQNWKRTHPDPPTAPVSAAPAPVVPTETPALPSPLPVVQPAAVKVERERAPVESQSRSVSSSPPRPRAFQIGYGNGWISQHANGRGWYKVPSAFVAPFAVRISGTLTLQKPSTDGRDTLGFHGIQFNKVVAEPLLITFLFAPSQPYASLTGRYCNLDGCDQPFQVVENPFVVCKRSNDDWLELVINGLNSDGQYAYAVGLATAPQGIFTLTPVPVPQDACKSQ